MTACFFSTFLYILKKHNNNNNNYAKCYIKIRNVNLKKVWSISLLMHELLIFRHTYMTQFASYIRNHFIRLVTLESSFYKQLLRLINIIISKVQNLKNTIREETILLSLNEHETDWLLHIYTLSTLNCASVFFWQKSRKSFPSALNGSFQYRSTVQKLITEAGVRRCSSK